MREEQETGRSTTAVLSDEHFDVVVLGGGSAAEELCESLAEKATDEKVPLSVAVIEERLVGGECPYLACMPSKALLRSSALRQLSKHASRLGVEEPARTAPLAAWREAVSRRDLIAEGQDDSEHVSSLEGIGVKLLRGSGEIEAWGSVLVHGKQGTRRLYWKDLVIATGSQPSLPPIEGLADVMAWTSDDALSSPELPKSLAILGGGPVGCELAGIYAAYLDPGSVHLIESSARLLSKEEETISDKLAELFSSRGVTLHLGVELSRVRGDAEGIDLELGDGQKLSVARLIVATGRAPETKRLSLERLGIEVSGALSVDDRCLVAVEESGGRRVFAIGDVNGVAPFTHVAKYQGRIVAGLLTGSELRADNRALPRCVYTDPPVAAVGLTSAQARAEGIGVCEAEMELSETARAEAEGRLSPEQVLAEAGGWVKLVGDRQRAVLVGASLIGPKADEWLGELTLAIRAEVPLAVLADTVHPFPTYCEALTPLYRELARKCPES
jgi:pyruvate/2-oxoglutarate dehydrogenase complex dihydrolipoamide dehydrogenase (E3) component